MSVYFAQVGPYIKIGYSANPERRVRNLMASGTRYTAPADTPLDEGSRRLIRYIDGELATEQAIHVALQDFTLGLEWYVDEPEVRDFIATAEPSLTYPRLRRQGGPVVDWLDPWRGLTAAEVEHAKHVIDNLFAGTSLRT